MTQPEVRTPVALRTLHGIEMAAVGTWKASTGETTFTVRDFTDAVAALECPGIRNPVIKLGHAEEDSTSGVRWDGEPALGWVANMRFDGAKLIGDFTGMPGWLVDADEAGLSVMASAYPDRSIEIYRPFICQIGHLHPSVVTAISLLGVAPPGIGVLKSMQDVYAAFTQENVPVQAAAGHPVSLLTSVTLAAAADDRRELTDIEKRSGVDFEQLQEQWSSALDDLVTGWDDISSAQRDQLSAQIADAVDNRPDDLGNLTVDSAAAALALLAAMRTVAEQAADEQVAAAAKQNVALPVVPVTEDDVRPAAEAITSAMAAGTAGVAGRAAAQALGTGDGKHVAGQTVDYLKGLTDRFLRDQLGGALSMAQHAGRMAVLDGWDGEVDLYASEVNDKNACLHPDTPVSTARGVVRADSVQIGDRLLTHSGRWLPVADLLVTEVDEEMVCLDLADGRTVRVTYDHPVAVAVGDSVDWRHAGELAVGDFMVDQSTAKLGREIRVPDLNLGQPPDGVTARFQVRRLSPVNMRAKSMPIRSVSLDDQRVVNDEVACPWTNGYLSRGHVAKLKKRFSDATFNGCFQPAPDVAVGRTIAADFGRTRNNPEVNAAKLASNDHRWTTARLGAVASSFGLAMPKSTAASDACRVYSSRSVGTLSGAVVPSVGRSDRDIEIRFASRAVLGDALQGRSELGSPVGIGVGAYPAAVDRPMPVPPGNYIAAPLAVLVGSLERPSGASSAGTALGTDGHGSLAGNTRLVHDISVVEISAIRYERHAGPVFDFHVPGDETFFANGVLVHNCSNCRSIDGAKFDSRDQADAAYGGGKYVACLGGARCRGQLIAVFGSDAARASALHTTIATNLGGQMPAVVKASVSVEDISRKYYESAGYSMWISELQVDPLQLIAADDATGKYYRIPVELSGETFTFGEPQEVAIAYQDVKTAARAGAKFGSRKLALAAAGKQEDGSDLVAADVSPAGAAMRKVKAEAPVGVLETEVIQPEPDDKTPDADPATGPTTTPKEASVDAAKMREALGLGPDAGDEELRQAFASQLTSTVPATPPPLDIDAVSALAASGQAVLVDKAQLSALVETARKGEIAYNQNRRNERDTFLSGAVREGRIPPASLAAYEKLWDNDPEGTRKTVSLLARNIIPVAASGFAGQETDLNEADAAYAAMYPEAMR